MDLMVPSLPNFSQLSCECMSGHLRVGTSSSTSQARCYRNYEKSRRYQGQAVQMKESRSNLAVFLAGKHMRSPKISKRQRIIIDEREPRSMLKRVQGPY